MSPRDLRGYYGPIGSQINLTLVTEWSCFPIRGMAFAVWQNTAVCRIADHRVEVAVCIGARAYEIEQRKSVQRGWRIRRRCRYGNVRGRIRTARHVATGREPRDCAPRKEAENTALQSHDALRLAKPRKPAPFRGRHAAPSP